MAILIHASTGLIAMQYNTIYVYDFPPQHLPSPFCSTGPGRAPSPGPEPLSLWRPYSACQLHESPQRTIANSRDDHDLEHTVPESDSNSETGRAVTGGGRTVTVPLGQCQ